MSVRTILEIIVWSLATVLLVACATIDEDEIEVGATQLTSIVVNETVQRGGVDWPGWRGADGDGFVRGLEIPLASLSSARWKESWRRHVGSGYSGVIVTGERVYCLARQETDHEFVNCYDAASGDLLWAVGAEMEPWKQPWMAGGITNGPLATPTYADGHVYSVGIHGRVRCHDAVTGRLVFDVKPEKLDARKSEYLFGHASSPIVYGGLVIVSLASGKGGSVVALDASDGSLVWRALPETVAYTSPAMMEVDGVPMLVVRSWERIVGLAPESGEILWQHAAVARGMRRDCASPVIAGNLVFVTNEYHGTIALQVSSNDDGAWQAERLYRSGGLAASTSTPVYVSGSLYGLHKRGRFVCIDANSGRRRWGVKKFDQHACVIASGSHGLVLDNRGLLALVKFDSEHATVLREWTIGADTWGHPAAVRNRLFFRDGEDLVCVELVTSQ